MSHTPGSSLKNHGRDFISKRHHDSYPFIDAKRQRHSSNHVVITGASKGIGRAIAVAYAKAGAAAVVLVARSSLDATEAAILEAAKAAGYSPPKVVKLSVDIQSSASVQEAARKTKDELGHVDIVINNAGYMEPFKLLAESDPGQWRSTWDINVVGQYHILRFFLPLVLDSPNTIKTVCSLSSIGAHQLTPGSSAYQTSKLAGLRLLEFLSAEYKSKGLVAYSVDPGIVPTEMGYKLPSDSHHLLRDKPELSADSIVFLTAENRPWLAGRYINSQWDMERLMQKRDEIVKGDLLKVRMSVEIPKL